MQTKHTKGEWKITGNETNPITPKFIQCGTRIICDVHGWDLEANAKLIAAAPDLIEALQTLITTFDNHNSGAIQYAKEVIKKAIG